MPDGMHLIAVRDLPSLHAKLLVHQRERAVLETADLFVGRVQTIAIVLSIAVVFCSTILAIGIVRRYENRLANVNENLERLVEARSKALVKSRSAVIFGRAVPVTDYVSTINVVAKSDGVSTVTWSSTFVPNAGKEKDALEALTGIYDAGLTTIKSKFAK